MLVAILNYEIKIDLTKQNESTKSCMVLVWIASYHRQKENGSNNKQCGKYNDGEPK